MELLRDHLFPMYKAVVSLDEEAKGVYQECEECGGNLYRCDCLMPALQKKIE